MNTATDTNKTQTPKSDGGYEVGRSATDKVGFYGTTPVVQPSGAAQAAITDPGDGTAAPTNGVLSLTGSYNSTILENAFSTLIAQGNALRAALVEVGIIAGE